MLKTQICVTCPQCVKIVCKGVRCASHWGEVTVQCCALLSLVTNVRVFIKVHKHTESPQKLVRISTIDTTKLFHISSLNTEARLASETIL